MLSHVPDAYRHYAKLAVPQDIVAVSGATLKFYHVTRLGEPVPAPVDALTRVALAEDPSFAFEDDHGFCLLHRCGADFYFLLPTVWRGANEAWEAVWYLHGDMPAFRPFELAYPPAAAPLRPTFCVWELGVVAHEAAAWSRFLASPRDQGALTQWLQDSLEGAV